MEYKTKDSGERKEFKSGMKRDIEKGKPRFDLLIPSFLKYDETMLYRLAMLLSRGVEKYGERNWEKSNSKEELDRFKSSAFRHFMQWFSNEEDEDHASAVFYNIMAFEAIKSKK